MILLKDSKDRYTPMLICDTWEEFKEEVPKETKKYSKESYLNGEVIFIQTIELEPVKQLPENN
jgi:hypothetical protein